MTKIHTQNNVTYAFEIPVPAPGATWEKTNGSMRIWEVSFGELALMKKIPNVLSGGRPPTVADYCDTYRHDEDEVEVVGMVNCTDGAPPLRGRSKAYELANFLWGPDSPNSLTLLVDGEEVCRDRFWHTFLIRNDCIGPYDIPDTYRDGWWLETEVNDPLWKDLYEYEEIEERVEIFDFEDQRIRRACFYGNPAFWGFVFITDGTSSLWVPGDKWRCYYSRQMQIRDVALMHDKTPEELRAFLEDKR